MIVILKYSFLIGSLLVESKTIKLNSLTDCLKEKDRIEQYYLQEYKLEDYTLQSSCEFYGR